MRAKGLRGGRAAASEAAWEDSEAGGAGAGPGGLQRDTRNLR